MIIPGILIAAATFPGIMVHELAHQLFCRWFKVPVFSVCYFQFDNPAGYVIHEVPKNSWHSVLISVGPFILNTVLGFLISFSAALSIKMGEANLMDMLMIYLGFSIAMHAFPSTGDAASMWQSVMNNENSSLLVKIFVAPVCAIIYLGAIGSVFWLDALYGLAISYFAPIAVAALTG